MELWINSNAEMIDGLLADKSTVSDLLVFKGWRKDGIAVELNGLVVPKHKHNEQFLQPGDKIEVVTLIGGG